MPLLSLRPRPPRWWQRSANRFESALYRRTGRSLGSARADVVLLTTTGRRSGQPRSNPISVAVVDDGLVVGGGAGGIATDPDWVRNLRAEPSCTVTRGRIEQEMIAREIVGAEYDERRAQLLARYPFAERYERMAGRPIPLFLLHEA